MGSLPVLLPSLLLFSKRSLGAAPGCRGLLLVGSREDLMVLGIEPRVPHFAEYVRQPFDLFPQGTSDFNLYYEFEISS